MNQILTVEKNRSLSLCVVKLVILQNQLIRILLILYTVF